MTDQTFYYCQTKNFTFFYKRYKNIIRTHGYVYIYWENVTIHELFIYAVVRAWIEMNSHVRSASELFHY